jgi:hypothetical protein
MADRPSFAEILVSQLGRPKEPLGWEELLALAVLAVAILGYVALEYGAVRLVAKFFAWLNPASSQKPPPEE